MRLVASLEAQCLLDPADANVERNQSTRALEQNVLQETDPIHSYVIKPSVSNSLKDYNFPPYSAIDSSVLGRDKIPVVPLCWFYK